MAELARDDFSVSNSIATFVVRVGSILEQEDVCFRLAESGMIYRVNFVEAEKQGIFLELHGYGSIYVGVEQIEADSFFFGDSPERGIIPDWMVV
ncbi:MAG: hypothetical protein ABIS50_00605 [Luteolibacter sp.]|uniref:hypothetical protein n=1 Tax=Luteolibacter sp. TaxID=1962973 RepID=UPI00326702B8